MASLFARQSELSFGALDCRLQTRMAQLPVNITLFDVTNVTAWRPREPLVVRLFFTRKPSSKHFCFNEAIPA
jgi:hypothetical protein